jgi:hypothetical protein
VGKKITVLLKCAYLSLLSPTNGFGCLPAFFSVATTASSHHFRQEIRQTIGQMFLAHFNTTNWLGVEEAGNTPKI